MLLDNGLASLLELEYLVGVCIHVFPPANCRIITISCWVLSPEPESLTQWNKTLSLLRAVYSEQKFSYFVLDSVRILSPIFSNRLRSSILIENFLLNLFFPAGFSDCTLFLLVLQCGLTFDLSMSIFSAYYCCYVYSVFK